MGAVYVAMRRCIGRLISFVATYATITLAFTLGLHFIFKVSVPTATAATRTTLPTTKTKTTAIWEIMTRVDTRSSIVVVEEIGFVSELYGFKFSNFKQLSLSLSPLGQRYLHS